MPRKKPEGPCEISELYSGRVLVKFYPEAKRNRYVVSIDGQDTKPPSVTQITSVYDRSSPLMNWAINNTVEVVRESVLPGMSYNEAELATILEKAKKQSNWLKNKAAEIGTLTHDWLWRWLKGEVTDLPPKDARHRPCVDASIDFITTHNVRFLHVERAIYSLEHGYSGRLDGIAEVDGELCLIDWKTGGGIYVDGVAQSAAYDKAIEEELGLVLANRWIIRLAKDTGQFHKHRFSRNERDRDFSVFLGLKAAFDGAKLIDKQLREDAKAEKAEARTETEQPADWLETLEA